MNYIFIKKYLVGKHIQFCILWVKIAKTTSSVLHFVTDTVSTLSLDD